MKLVVQELTIAAPPPVVFAFLVDPDRLVEWMADTATLDPLPGGQIRWTHANGDVCSGNYLEDLAADAHRGGWTHYLARLRGASEGRPPGPDPFVDQRVPTPEELRE